MSRPRLIIACSLTAFLAVVLALSLSTWTWHSPLETPVGVKAADLTVTCGAPWGAASARTSSPTLYIPEGKPCAQRSQYQIMSAVDLVLGVGAVLAFVTWSRRRSRDVEVAPAG